MAPCCAAHRSVVRHNRTDHGDGAAREREEEGDPPHPLFLCERRPEAGVQLPRLAREHAHCEDEHTSINHQRVIDSGCLGSWMEQAGRTFEAVERGGEDKEAGRHGLQQRGDGLADQKQNGGRVEAQADARTNGTKCQVSQMRLECVSKSTKRRERKCDDASVTRRRARTRLLTRSMSVCCTERSWRNARTPGARSRQPHGSSHAPSPRMGSARAACSGVECPRGVDSDDEKAWGDASAAPGGCWRAAAAAAAVGNGDETTPTRETAAPS